MNLKMEDVVRLNLEKALPTWETFIGWSRTTGPPPAQNFKYLGFKF